MRRKKRQRERESKNKNGEWNGVVAKGGVVRPE